MRSFCVAIFMLLISVESSSASFDCDSASTKIEKMICSDQDASNLDHELSQVYKWSLEWASEEGKARFKLDQINWLKSRRDRCEDVECIKKEYKIRLYEISRLSSKHEMHTFSYKGNAFHVLNLFSTNDRLESFNKSGKGRSSGNIIECSILIEIGVGTARGNRSYGGYCIYQEDGHELRVNVCDDEMVGHYKLAIVDKVSGVNELSKFVLDNCYGG